MNQSKSRTNNSLHYRINNNNNKRNSSHPCTTNINTTASYTLAYSTLPDWYKDNEYLILRYRPIMDSYINCFRSAFSIHNETGNIWSHFLGFALMGFFLITALFVHTFKLSDNDEQLYNFTNIEKAMFIMFVASSMICMLSSSLFHTFCCKSISAHKYFGKLDYAGIAFLIAGSALNYIYYIFTCTQLWLTIYSAVFTIGCFGCIFASFHPKFGTPDYRTARCAIYTSYALFGLIPGIHVLLLNNSDVAYDRYGLHWILAMSFVYLLGGLFFSIRVPERFFPGKCDILIQSHQIFHVSVILGVWSTWEAILIMANYRHKNPSLCMYDNL